MASTSPGISSLTRVEAIFRNPALYELSSRIPTQDRTKGGRRRLYPNYMVLAFEALLSVYESARQVEAELAHPAVWELIRRIVRERFPTEPSMHLPAKPMKRFHYRYARDRHLCDPDVLAQIMSLHREIAAGQARSLGLLDPAGPGSFTKPDLSRLLHADGKVVTSLYKARFGDTRIDRQTGEIKPVRYEPDAGLHFEGDGEVAWGTKFVLVATRSSDQRGRIILDLEWVPKPGGEAAVAVACFRRLAPLVPGAQGVVYDTALRGVHHQVLLRELGLLPINRVTAQAKGVRTPRRKDGRRVAKSIHVEDKQVRLPDASTRTIRLYARDGAIGIGELTESGDLRFIELARVRTHRSRGKAGLYRWYNDYALPIPYGGGTITVRLHATETDVARKLNRTENVRAIPASDPHFARLYARRNDAESINRGLVDSLYLGRAHSVGHFRQLANLLGYALMVNSVALFTAGRSAPPATRVA